MTTSDWITLGAAILVGGGTLFLGIMAWRAIRQSRSIQKAEKRERLLNEIIEWAVSIRVIGFQFQLSIPESKDKLRITRPTLEKIIFAHQIPRQKSIYITHIARIFGEDLHTHAKVVSDNLSDLIYAMSDSILKQNLKDPADADKIFEREKALKESVELLIEKATDHKVRTIK